MLAFLDYLSPKNFETLLVFSATGNSKKHTEMREKYTEEISVANKIQDHDAGLCQASNKFACIS